MQAAYKIYFQDEGEKFIFEAAWRLLKDEPKWLAGSSEASTKRTKNSASGAYSSSSNPPTPTSSGYNPPSPTLSRRPIGQKAAKRKEKEKFIEMSTTPNKEKKVDAKIKKAESAEERLKMNDLQILSKDTSNMNTRQLQAHEILCDMIREKYGIN
ncbi:unnamed protein product [Vicia faba]|nr:unnamed protein product [Vicia faba]